MFVQRIPTEYAYGVIGGVDYGSKVRVVMRSPIAVIFVGYGVNMMIRGARGHPSKICTAAKADKMSEPQVARRIVEAFGEGADVAVLQALIKRGEGTVLFDGGGKRLPLPAVEQRAITEAEYAKVSPSMDIVPEGVKTCMQCGSPLPIQTNHHHLGKIKDNHPRSLEDCQRLTNHPVVTVRGFGMVQDRDHWPFVDWFATWDGESYIHETFCTDRCAAAYGRRAAAQLPPLEVGGEAPRAYTYVPREDVYHYDVAAEAAESHARIVESFAKMKKYQEKTRD